MMKNLFAAIGIFVVFLSILGMTGIGNFVMIYDSKKITCVKE
jgi:hypothetical protein